MKSLFKFLSQAFCLFLILGSKFSRNIVLSFVKKMLLTCAVVGFPVVILETGRHHLPTFLLYLILRML
jgi:hypothetical protein